MASKTRAGNPTPRQRLAADDRRRAILDSARRAFARNGFRAASTAAIAGGAGCSEPLLYKLYPTKQALFAAVLRDASTEMSRLVIGILDGGADPVQALAEVAHRACTDELVIEIVRLRMLAVSLADEPLIRSALVESVDKMRRGVAGQIEAGQRYGGVRRDVDADALVWLWTGFTLMAGYRLALEGQEAIEDAPRVADTFLKLIRDPAGGKE